MVTIADLIENAYNHHLRMNKKTWARNCWRLWKTHLYPFFGELPAEQLTTKLQNQYRDHRAAEKAAPATINMELQVLRRAYKLGLRHEPAMVKHVPYFVIVPVDNARKVFIDLNSLQKIRAAAEADSPWMRLAVEMGYVYGWRRGEILAVRACDVDLFDGVIRLQTSKNGDAREVPITPEIERLLVPVLEGLEPAAKIIPRCYQVFGWHWNDVKKAAGCPRFKFHDYRRTSAKAKSAAGVPQHVIMKLQGWKTDAMFRRYAIVDPSDAKAALAAQVRWEEEKMGKAVRA